MMDTLNIQKRASMLQSLRNSEKLALFLPLLEQRQMLRRVRELRHAVWQTANVTIPTRLYRNVLCVEANLLNYSLRKDHHGTPQVNNAGKNPGSGESYQVASDTETS